MRARLRIVARRTRLRGRGDLAVDLIVDRLRDLAHREIVILNGAVARDFAGASAAFRHLEIGGRDNQRAGRRRGRRGRRAGGVAARQASTLQRPPETLIS